MCAFSWTGSLPSKIPSCAPAAHYTIWTMGNNYFSTQAMVHCVSYNTFMWVNSASTLQEICELQSYLQRQEVDRQCVGVILRAARYSMHGEMC